MKKIYWIFALVMSLCLIFSAAGAFDSPWDHFNGPKTQPGQQTEPVISEPVDTMPDSSEPEPMQEMPSDGRETIADGLKWPETDGSDVNTVTYEPLSGTDMVSPDFFDETARSGSFKVDSITIAGMDDPSSRQVLDLIESLEIDFISQQGSAPRTDLALSMGDAEILKYSIQRTVPYYVSSNFLGSDTYMISDEDQFEEKLVTALYALIEKMSDGNVSLPPLEDILAGIAKIRNRELLPTSSFSSMTLTQEIDTSALMTWVFSVMGRFVEADPDPAIDYRYTDFNREDMHFAWPARSSLPDPADAGSAITAVFYGEDIIDLLGVLEQLLTDNPELADMINQALAQQMKGSEAPDITSMITNMKESSSENLKSMVINFRMDQDNSGSPARITLDFGSEEGGNSSGMTVTVTIGQGDSGVAVDVAGDAYSGNQFQPIFRALFVMGGGDVEMTGNLFIASQSGNDLEFALAQDIHDAGSDTQIDYFTGENSGTIMLLNTSTPNSYGSTDSTGQIALTHYISGQPAISVVLSTSGTAVPAFPALTPADAVHASDMTGADYDTLAQNIFMQIMSLMMNFM